MSTEVLAAETWLYATLHGDATLHGLVAGQVYARQAPATATMPFVVFHPSGERDVMGVSTTRIVSSLLYTVRGVTDGESLLALDTLAARIDTLLHGQRGATVLACAREQAFSMTEFASGITYQHLGGVYRLTVRP